MARPNTTVLPATEPLKPDAVVFEPLALGVDLGASGRDLVWLGLRTAMAAIPADVGLGHPLRSMTISEPLIDLLVRHPRCNGDGTSHAITSIAFVSGSLAAAVIAGPMALSLSIPVQPLGRVASARIGMA